MIVAEIFFSELHSKSTFSNPLTLLFLHFSNYLVAAFFTAEIRLFKAI